MAVDMSRDLNKYDNARGARVTDALLGYETVKYFSNERRERDRCGTYFLLSVPLSSPQLPSSFSLPSCCIEK